MGILNLLSVSAPGGLWGNLINSLSKGFASYAVVLILLTIMVRAVILPLDVVNKYSSKINSRKQAEVKPELDKINKQYANNKEMLNKKTMEVYRNHNYNLFGTCFALLLYMVLTMVVFFTLFSALNKMSAYKIYNQYQDLRTTYAVELGFDEEEIKAGNVTDQQIIDAATITGESTPEQIALVEAANNAVVAKFDETKQSFLWIKNIWRPDSSAKPVLDYKTFVSSSKLTNAEKEKITEECYNVVMKPVMNANNGWNGYFILAIVAAGTTLLSFYMNTLISKIRAKKMHKEYIPDAGSNKTMLFIMPVIMGIFTLFYNAAFGLYIVTGNLFAVVTGPLITLLVEWLDELKQKKKNKKVKVSYSRK